MHNVFFVLRRAIRMMVCSLFLTFVAINVQLNCICSGNYFCSSRVPLCALVVFEAPERSGMHFGYCDFRCLLYSLFMCSDLFQNEPVEFLWKHRWVSNAFWVLLRWLICIRCFRQVRLLERAYQCNEMAQAEISWVYYFLAGKWLCCIVRQIVK